MQARAPHALARALTATAVVVAGAACAHAWAGGNLPTGPGLVLVTAVVLAGGLLVFTRDVPAWAVLPAVAGAQLGLHETFGLVAGHEHHAAMTAEPGWTWQMGVAHLFVTALTAPCGGPVGARGPTSSPSASARPSPSSRDVPRRRTEVPLRPSLVLLLVSAAGVVHLWRSVPPEPGPGPGGHCRPQTRTTSTQENHVHPTVHPHPRAPRRAHRRHVGHRALARRTRQRARQRVGLRRLRRRVHHRHLQRPARLRRIAHHQDRDPGPGVGPVGDADPQPVLRRRVVDRPSSTSRRPTPTATR